LKLIITIHTVRAWKYWNINNDASNDEFFIRVGTFDLTDNSVGVGVDRNTTCDTCSIDLKNGMRLQAKMKDSLNYAAWWYVSANSVTLHLCVDDGRYIHTCTYLDNVTQIKQVGGTADEHIIIKSYKDDTFCWDVPEGKFDSGANLRVNKCDGTPDQQFVIVPFGRENKG
jgi:hypothetical protein